MNEAYSIKMIGVCFFLLYLLSQAEFIVKQVEMPWSNDLLLSYDLLNLSRGKIMIKWDLISSNHRN